MMARRLSLLALVASLELWSCGGTRPPCTAGTVTACTCDGGAPGHRDLQQRRNRLRRVCLRRLPRAPRAPPSRAPALQAASGTKTCAADGSAFGRLRPVPRRHVPPARPRPAGAHPADTGTETCASDGSGYGTCGRMCDRLHRGQHPRLHLLGRRCRKRDVRERTAAGYGTCTCMACAPGSSQSCSCSSGVGTETCLSSGSGYGTCTGCDVCTPASTKACTCPGSGSGTATCNSAGTAYGACGPCACTAGSSVSCTCSGGGTGTQSLPLQWFGIWSLARLSGVHAERHAGLHLLPAAAQAHRPATPPGRATAPAAAARRPARPGPRRPAPARMARAGCRAATTPALGTARASAGRPRRVTRAVSAGDCTSPGDLWLVRDDERLSRRDASGSGDGSCTGANWSWTRELL